MCECAAVLGGGYNAHRLGYGNRKVSMSFRLERGYLNVVVCVSASWRGSLTMLRVVYGTRRDLLVLRFVCVFLRGTVVKKMRYMQLCMI